jgi:hypothetical protein
MRSRILVLATAVSCIWSCGRGPVELALRLEKGQRLALSVSVSQTVKQGTRENPSVLSQRTRVGYGLEVVARDPGGLMGVKIRYRDLALSVQGLGSVLSFDSGSPDSATPGLELLAGLIGEGYDFLVDSRGVVGRVEGIPELITAVLSKTARGEAPAMQRSLEMLLDEQAVRATLGSFLDYFPEHKVAVGDAWVVERNRGGVVPMGIRNTWSMRRLRRSVAALALDGVLSSAEPRSGVVLSGTQTGTAEVDVTTGFLIQADIRQSIRGSILAQGTVIPVEMESETSIRRTAN